MLQSPHGLRRTALDDVPIPTSPSRQRPLAVTGLRFLDADPMLDRDPGLIDGERLGPRVDIRPAQAEYFIAAQAMKRQAPCDVEPVRGCPG